MGATHRALVALGLVAALAGCGSRVQPSALTRAPDPTAPGAAQTTVPEVPAVQPSVAPSGSAPAAPAPTQPPLGSQPTDPASPYHNNGNIKLAFSSLCVRPGDVMVVTITGGANAGLAMTATFSDGDPHGAYNAGEADGQGVFRWRFPILPGTPPGRARVYVMSTGTNWEGKDGGTAESWFQVAGREGCVA